MDNATLPTAVNMLTPCRRVSRTRSIPSMSGARAGSWNPFSARPPHLGAYLYGLTGNSKLTGSGVVAAVTGQDTTRYLSQ